MRSCFFSAIIAAQRLRERRWPLGALVRPLLEVRSSRMNLTGMSVDSFQSSRSSHARLLARLPGRLVTALAHETFRKIVRRL